MTIRVASLSVLATLCAAFAAHAAEPTASPATATNSESAGPAVNTSAMTPTNAAAPKPATAKPAATKPAATATRQTNASDRLNLGTTTVTGNRELPKVLYIVPWKKADIGELPAQPFNTLLDEVLTPVDRDVFRREVTYYGAISGGAQIAPPGASGAAREPRGPTNGPANGPNNGPNNGSEK
jgi:hypothetical protein